MKTANTLVSVIIPTYNRAKTLPRAVKSVLAQTYQNFELIVIDDCSQDNTDETLEQFDDNRIKYIRHSHNKGGGAARNTGIACAIGKYIAFLDSDDVWLKEKVEEQIKFFKKLPGEYGVIYTGFNIINSMGYKIKTVSPELRGDVLNLLLTRNYIGTLSTPLIKSSYLNQVRGLDECLPSCQDWDLYIALAQKCKFDYISAPLTDYYDASDKVRISKKANAVISGHKIILKKYGDLVSGLSRNLQAEHYNYVGKKMFEVGSIGFGMALNYKAFAVSGKVSYLLRIIKRFIKR